MVFFYTLKEELISKVKFAKRILIKDKIEDWRTRWSRRPLLMKTPKSQLTAEQPIDEKGLEATKKDSLLPKTKKKP